MIKKRRIPVLAVAAIALTAVSAFAYWTTNSTAGSLGSAASASVNGGATPSAALGSVGREVSVSWGASTLSNGAPVAGYLLKRYPDGGGVPAISPIGSCTGTVSGVTCVEDDTPPGYWRYTVTPVVGSWHGAESALSGLVIVGSATLTVNGSPFGNAAFTPAFATTTGSITGFSGTGTGGHGENVSYRLDAATSLTGSPTYVGTDGNTAVSSLGIPKSGGDGPHTVYALGDAAYQPSQASVGIVIDTTAPSVGAMLSPAANAAGWNNSTPVSVSLSANDDSGSGLAQIKYTVDGSDPTTSGTAQVYSGSPLSFPRRGRPR